VVAAALDAPKASRRVAKASFFDRTVAVIVVVQGIAKGHGFDVGLLLVLRQRAAKVSARAKRRGSNAHPSDLGIFGGRRLCGGVVGGRGRLRFGLGLGGLDLHRIPLDAVRRLADASGRLVELFLRR